MKIKAIFQKIQRRNEPMTVCHWRFFVLGGDQATRLQRFVFWRQNKRFPVIVRVVWWFFSQFRWFFFNAPSAIYKAYKVCSTSVTDEHGVSKPRQLLGLCHLAYGFSAPPRLYYNNQLYAYAARQWLTFVFDFQSTVWHSAFLKDDADLLLLDDKHAFAQQLASKGVPCIPTIAFTNADEAVLQTRDLERLPDSFFCKPVSANQSQGCLSVVRQGDDYRVHDLFGRVVTSGMSAEPLLKRLNAQPYLVQALLNNDPELVALMGERLSVVRLVTMQQEGEFRVVQAYWDFNLLGNVEARVVAKINVDDGQCVVSNSFCLERDKPELELLLPTLNVWLSENWREMVLMCEHAHRQIPSMFSIGWDAAFSDKGLVLIEGNSHWALELQQDLEGQPLLSSDRAALYAAQLDALK